LKKASFTSPSKPSLSLLLEAAPAPAWKAVFSEASRSPMQGYRTGAVLIDKNGDVVIKGCSHPSLNTKMNSIHAERHCLLQAQHIDLRDTTCLVYTKSSRSGGAAWTSRPCLSCAKSLVKRGVKTAIYPVRDPESGIWRIEEDSMTDVFQSTAIGNPIFARGLARI
jgi:deoxycytidylate deaminase